PVLLPVRARRAARVRPRQGVDPRRLAAPALQPLEPRRRRLRPRSEALRVIVFSPLTPIEHLLRHVLDWLHATIGLPWAWAIIALTVIVRVALVPLAVRQIHSMQAMQAHMPEMKSIQQKYKTDKKRQQEELMKFYRENKINPAASCLPLVEQIPVFFALYFVLRELSKHPPSGSLSWLHIVPNIADHASAHWSGYLLLVIYAASQ